MAYAETRSKLSLDRWARIMGISPLHFNGIQTREPGVCAAIWFQYEWQTADRVSREEVARAIAEAEQQIERHVGYRLLPSWEREEHQLTARGPAPEYIRVIPSEIRGFPQAVKANWGHVLSGGVRAQTLLEAGAAVVYTDGDGDGYDETATVTATVPAGTLPCEVRPFYPGESNQQYEIRPAAVSVAGVTATIVFRREQAVLKALIEREMIPTSDSQLRAVDGMVDANFLDEVDVYRVFNDPQTQATFLWEPFASCDCETAGGCTECQFSTQTGCLIEREKRLGWVGYRPATWNATTAVFDGAEWAVERQPEMARLYYYAGWQDLTQTCPRVQMDPGWERTVAYFAAALLDRPICECNNVHAWLDHWRRDLAIPGKDEGLRISDADLRCPFGTRRGAVNAWHRLREEGVSIGRVAVG